MKRWQDLRRQRLSSEQLQEVERQVEADLVDMDLRSIREVLGKTQEELAELAQMTQSEISRFERRADHRLSTLKRVVDALGGEVEVVATFGDKRVRLRAVG